MFVEEFRAGTQSSLVDEAQLGVEGGQLGVFLLHHVSDEVQQSLRTICGLCI